MRSVVRSGGRCGDSALIARYVADADLRDRDLLSDEEYELHKAKLLER